MLPALILASIIGFYNPHIEETIIYLATVEYEREQMKFGVNWGPHEILNNEKLISDITISVSVISVHRQVDPLLILAVMWRESRFDPRIVSLKRSSPKGARGLMQVLGVAAQGCDLNTVYDQIDCGVIWLDREIKRCGSLAGGMSAYITGTCPVIGTARSRINLYHRIKAWASKKMF